MPAIGAAIAAAVSGFSFTSFVFKLAVSFVMSALVRSFADKPEGRKPQDRQEMIRSGVDPRRVIYGKVRVSGTLVYATSTGATNNYLHLVVVLAGHLCTSIDKVWIDEDELIFGEDFNLTPESPLYGYVDIYPHLGADDQPADQVLIEASDGEWTAAHQGKGICYVHLRLKYNASKFPVGIPIPRFLVSGKPLYDPRSGLTEWSDNGPLCLADYLTAKIGVDADYSEINEADLIAAANISDEIVEILGGTEKRYTCNGTITADQTRETAINDLLMSFMGTQVYAGGQFSIFAGAPTAATYTITETDIVGAVRVSPRTPRNELFNTVRGIFANQEDLYQSVDFPIISNVTYVDQDKGEELINDLQMNFTVATSMAQRNAGIVLARGRQQIKAEIPCNISLLKVKAWDTVLIDLPELGWNNKKFRVNNWRMTAEARVWLEVQEEADSDWNWNYETDEQIQDPAPDTGFDSPFTHGPVTDVFIESGEAFITEGNDGSLLSNMRVSFTPPDQSDTIVVKYKLISETDYKVVPLFADTQSVIVGPVSDGKTYDVIVISYNAIKVTADTPAATTHTVIGKTSNPGEVDEFTIAAQPDGTRELNAIHLYPEADVRVGGGYDVRYQNGNTIDLNDAPSLNTGLITTWPWEFNRLSSGQWTFACIVVDVSGNRSQNPKIITANLPDPRMGTAVGGWEEFALGWPGDKVRGFVNYEGHLEAQGDDAIGRWADLPDTWAALTAPWAAIVPNKNPIFYMTEVYDIGVNIAITPIITVDAIGTYTILQRTHTEDQGPDLSAEPWVDQAQVSCRYIQFRIVVSGETPILRNLTPILDGEILIDDIADIDMNLGSIDNFELIAPGHFKIGVKKDIANIVVAQITAMQNTGAGWTNELITKSTFLADGITPAAEFKVYNANDNLDNCIIDLLLKGPKT